ncbi:MAG: hypothetical protein KDC05_09290 [Bacteroidales bacterium]|nr:hypothetical protein [Bacteroidales bacterium]
MDSTDLSGNNKKRPELLTWLCVLTFIGSGIAAFSNLVVFISYDELKVFFDQEAFDYSEFEVMLAGGKRFFAAGFVFYVLSLFGAFRMWNLYKTGFHFYTAAQVCILLLPFVFIKSAQFSVFNLLLTATFILGYASQLKFMKQ